MSSTLIRNALLNRLEPDTIERLDLRPVVLKKGQDLEIPGTRISHIVFIEQGLVSKTTMFRDGFQVEVEQFGYGAVMGLSALMGTKHSFNRVFMQLAGRGFSCSIENATEEFKRCGRFQLLALRLVQAQLIQATQTTACNAHHNHAQRLARWLLICSERSMKTSFVMSQEALAITLGSSRPTVSGAAKILKEHGLIEYKRGCIEILDYKGLEKHACECYFVVKHYLGSDADFDRGLSD